MPPPIEESFEDGLDVSEREAIAARMTFRVERKSVRLGLTCHRNRRWYSIVLLEAVERTEEASACVWGFRGGQMPSGGINKVASSLY
jgi:hypothetical protein